MPTKKAKKLIHVSAKPHWCIATCKPDKPRLTGFSETQALFFIQFLSFRKMKVQDRQNVIPGLPEKTGWLRACLISNTVYIPTPTPSLSHNYKW